jgi:4-amino-4-deoxy-L-arabinose transferase-like glycosyltransferase
MDKKTPRGILVICASYLLISLGFFIIIAHGRAFESVDTPSYPLPAEHLLGEGFLSVDGITPDYFRTPGYPLVLALVYGLGGGDMAVVIIQILLSTCKVYLCYRILIMLRTSPKWALFGTALMLFNITSYKYSLHVLSESLFGFLIILSLYLFVRYLYRGRNPWIFLAFSVALNYALLARPILIYFNLLAAAALLVCFILKKMPLRCFIMFFLCFSLVFGGWSYRNYRHSSVFTFSTVQALNMVYWNCPSLTAFMEHISVEEAQAYHVRAFEEQYPEAAGLKLDPRASQLWEKYGRAYIGAHFPQYLLVNSYGIIKELFGPVWFDKIIIGPASGLSAFSASPGYLAALALCLLYLAYHGLIYLGYVLGLVLNRRKVDTVQVLMFLTSGYLAAASAVLGYSRFRDPYFPLLVLGAACNGRVVWERLRGLIRIPKGNT